MIDLLSRVEKLKRGDGKDEGTLHSFSVRSKLHSSTGSTLILKSAIL